MVNLEAYNEEELIKDLIALKNEKKGVRSGRFTKTIYPKPATSKEAKYVRTKLKLSQAKFAVVLGVSTATIKSWEQGKRNPDGLASKTLRLLRKNPSYANELVKA